MTTTTKEYGDAVSASRIGQRVLGDDNWRDQSCSFKSQSQKHLDPGLQAQ